MIRAIDGKPGEGMTYSCLCQDCLHVQRYASEVEQFAAHDEKTRCEKCVKGVMCCCLDCLNYADELEQAVEL